MSDVLTGRRGRLALSAVSILAAIFIAAPILVLVPLAFSGSNNLLLPPDSFPFAGSSTWSSSRAGAIRPG